MVNVVNRDKASSHPSPMGGIYVGIVKTVVADGRVFVSIPKLGNTIGPLRVINSNINNPLVADEQVLCAFTSMSNDEMYVLGYVNSRDIFTPDLTTPSTGQTLQYNGTNWVNVSYVAPQSTVYASGSGTYTVPSGARWLSVKMVGGGGGGATGHSTGAANGLVGGNTTFGTGIASGGGGGLVNDNGGIGVASTMISGGTGLALAGGDGGPAAAPYGTGRAANEGGNGGSSAFGGGGSGKGGSNASSGGDGKANTGGGGGAGGGSNVPGTYAGGGGASGGYVECIIASPSATYSYAVGAGGAGGSNGSTAGGSGGSGVIYVVAYF